METQDELHVCMPSRDGEVDNAVDNMNPDVVCAVMKALTLADEMDASQVVL